MKKVYWWMVGGVGAVAFVGGVIAVMQPRTALPPEGSEPSSTDEVASQTGEDLFTPVSGVEEPSSSMDEDTAASEDLDPALRLTDFAHQRLEVVDQVAVGSEFSQFRDQLQQAIQNRDPDFIESILPPDGLAYGFGLPMTVADMELTDPNGWFWEALEKMMGRNSCEVDADYPPTTPGGEVWICPNVTKAFYRQYPPPEDAEGIEYEFSTVIVMGEGVNVRAAPNLEAQVVGILSNELVKLDQSERDKQLDQTPEDISSPIQGWTPVILPNQVRGYVFNRYAYQPLDPRALFEEIDGQWRMIRVLAGD